MWKTSTASEMRNRADLVDMSTDIAFQPIGKEYTVRELIRHLMGIYIFNGDMPVCFECNREATLKHYENVCATFDKKMAILDANDDSLGIEVTIN